MRGWSARNDPPLKKPALDIVEVVGELVDLTALSDDGASDGGDKKKDKKARKEQKRKEKERKREELRKAEHERLKAIREERLLEEATEEARRKAELAELRAAARREAYLRGEKPGGPEEVDSDSDEAAPAPEAKRARQAVPAAEATATAKAGVGGSGSPAAATAAGGERPSRFAAAAALVAAPPALAPAQEAEALAGRARAAEGAAPAKSERSERPDAQEGRPKAATGRKALGGISMAEAIAAAQKEQSMGASGFASFEGFDAQASHEKAHGLETEEFDPDDDDVNPEGLLPIEFYSLQDLPEKLLLAEMGSEPGLYIAHYVRYVLGAWQRVLVSGTALEGSGLTNQTAALFQSKEKFQSTAESLKPLLRQLRNRKINDEMLSGLEMVVKLAAEREYNHANSVYVGMTMGRKTWHNSLPCFQQQQNHGGSVRKIIKQSELVDFDWDPVVQAYMHALKRVIQFAQIVRPPDDPAKCA